MSQATKICKILIATGRWSKNNCHLCRKINKSTCSILIEQIEKKQLEDLDRFDERREMIEDNITKYREEPIEEKEE